MTRIGRLFDCLKRENRKGFIAYLTAGDPTPDHTPGLVEALVRGGADLIELGVPFSDPIADGPVIQRAGERAIKAGTTLASVLEIARKIRETSEGRVMTLSQPIRAKKPCLVCHDTPEKAPPSMLEKYRDKWVSDGGGMKHGFGWKANEIIGAQIVSAPIRLASEQARQNLLYMGVAFGVLVILGALLNVGLSWMVTHPVRTMRDARKASQGQFGAAAFKRRGSDLIARLDQSFTRMRRSLALRMSQRPEG